MPAPPTPIGPWAPSPIPWKGHPLSQALEVPVPRGRWDSGGGPWGAKRGSGRSWSLAVVGGGSCSGNQGSGSLPKYELSLRAEGLLRAGPGPMPQPTPACVGSQSGDTRRGWPGWRGTWEGVSRTRRWPRAGQGRSAGWQSGTHRWARSRVGPEVREAQPDGMEPLRLLQIRQGQGGSVLRR